MKVTHNEHYMVVVREDGDPKFYGIRGAKGEHAFLHYLKKYLNKNGFLGGDFVKRRMQKDGHMCGDQYQPYLRSRKAKGQKTVWAIYSGFYAIRGLDTDWNAGQVRLEIANIGSNGDHVAV